MGLLKKGRSKKKPPKANQGFKGHSSALDEGWGGYQDHPWMLVSGSILESSFGFVWGSSSLRFLHLRFWQWELGLRGQCRGTSASVASGYDNALKSKEAWDVSILKKGFSLGILTPLLSCTHTHTHTHTHTCLSEKRRRPSVMPPIRLGPVREEAERDSCQTSRVWQSSEKCWGIHRKLWEKSPRVASSFERS